MKRRNALIVMAYLTAFIFVSGNILAQSNSTNQNQNRVKNQVKTQEQNQNQEQNKNQVMPQDQNQYRNQTKFQIKLQNENQFRNKIHGNHFIDLNKDGYNDNAPDADGDGIPNGQDPDYIRPLNGKGSKFMGDRTGYGYQYKNNYGNAYGNCNGTGGQNGTNQYGTQRGGRR